MTPATTMRGALAASTDSSRPGVPMRSARRARSVPLKVRIWLSGPVVRPGAAGAAALLVFPVLPIGMAGLSFPGRGVWSGGGECGGAGGLERLEGVAAGVGPGFGGDVGADAVEERGGLGHPALVELG